MIKWFGAARATCRWLSAGVVALGLSACEPVSLGGLGGSGPSINTKNPVPVALLVPYGSGGTGESGLARSLENAARLAINDLDGVKIDLRVYGTAGSAQRAAQVAQQAIDEGAKIILGPVFGEAANAAGLTVASSGVNVLSFSNNTQIAGGNVFVLGNTFDNTARRLVSFAASQGKSRILTVHADTPTGAIGLSAIQKAISRSSASNAGTVGYQASQQGVISAVPEISRVALENQADAVFFTSDTLGGLPLLTQMLPENRINNQQFQFIGLTRWDIPGNTLALPGVQNGIFALPDPGLTAAFNTRYASAYGGQPHPIAGLAYDGIAAIGALVKSGNSGALTRAALTQSSGFRGVNGVFRLRGDGTNDRALAVARVTNRQVTIVSPAPSSFGFAGF